MSAPAASASAPEALAELTGGRPVAIAGAGLVGSGWATVFARAGLAVRAFDAHAATLAGLHDAVRSQLQALQRHGLLAEAVDAVGPFETIDLNAPGGVADYAQRLGPLYRGIAASRTHEADWSPALIAEVERQRRMRLPEAALAARRAWRDEALARLAGSRADEAAGGNDTSGRDGRST